MINKVMLEARRGAFPNVQGVGEEIGQVSRSTPHTVLHNTPCCTSTPAGPHNYYHHSSFHAKVDNDNQIRFLVAQ